MTQPDSDHEQHDSEESSGKTLLGRALKRAKNVADIASDATREMAHVVSSAADVAKHAVDAMTSGTARGVAGAANITTDAVRGVVTGTTETAREVALSMARTFLGKTTLTLPLPEALLNKQLRGRIEPRSDIDDLTVECGQDRFKIHIEGHYKRVLYHLSLDFNVLQCEISREKFLRLRQVDESLDIQFKDAGVFTNWAARKISGKAFDVVNSLPIPSLINHIIRDIPGIQQEDHRLWYIDLEKAGFIDFINNRSWMMDKLLGLTDFSILPGLNILRDSRDLMQQLVDQFEVRGLRVQPGRLEVQVGISKDV